MKKLFLLIGLTCTALPLKSATLRQVVARAGLAVRAGLQAFAAPSTAVAVPKGQVDILSLLCSLKNNPVKGPLFSGYLEKTYFQTKSHFLLLNTTKPQCFELLPSIIKYVEGQYQKNRIVFFHGRHPDQGFLEAIFRRLHALKTGKQVADDFVWVSFTKQSQLSDTEREDLMLAGITSRNRSRYEGKVLFTNLHLFANDEEPASNTWQYVINKSTRKRFDCLVGVERMCKELDLMEEYGHLQHDIAQLYALYTQMVEEQGSCGELLVISMPPKVARKISYVSRPLGARGNLYINGTYTSDTVTVADHFEQVTGGNEYVISLVEEMHNPEKAQQAGVQIEVFSLPKHYRTQQWKNFEAQLTAVMARFEKLYSVRQARESKEVFKACEAGMGGW